MRDLSPAATNVILDRERERVCRNEACRLFQAELRDTRQETNNVIYVSNSNATVTHLSDLVQQQWSEGALQDGVRCESCKNTAQIRERTVPKHLPSTLLFGFPRPVPHGGRWQRNHFPITCADDIRMQGVDYTLAALVEHIPTTVGHADGGHYVAWARKLKHNAWLRLDDSVVEKHLWLPHSVRTNVVLAVYERQKPTELPVQPSDRLSSELSAAPSASTRPGSARPPCAAAQTFASEHNACEGDTECEFNKLAADFYGKLATAKSVEQCLAEMPTQLSCWARMSLEESLRNLREGLCNVKRESLSAQDEVDVFLPMWRTMPLAFALVFETLSRALSLPFVMLWDAFKVVLSSLLHKDLAIQWQEYDMRHRYWAVVTSDPGAGKSPALNFVMSCLLEAMDDLEDQATFPGVPEDNFHIVHDSTHAAFAARLNRAQGYALLASPESATTLCPKFPTSGEFSKTSHIDLERCLEGASGGAIHWDTQESVLNRARNARCQEQLPDKGVHHDSTNFAFVLFQQVSMLQSWWAQGEARWKKGLTNRFLFSTGRRPIECPVAPGMTQKLRKYLVNFLRKVAKQYGAAEQPRAAWKLQPAVHDAFLEARAICNELAQEKVFADGGSLHSMLEKVPYWLCHEGFMNEVLFRLTADIAYPGQPQAQLGNYVSQISGQYALEFVHLRLVQASVATTSTPLCLPEHVFGRLFFARDTDTIRH